MIAPAGTSIEFLDEARALRAQALDDVAVVDDLVADVDGRAVLRERLLDDVDRADHARAKAARLRKNHPHRGVAVRNGD